MGGFFFWKGCDVSGGNKTADEEFLLSKRQYQHITGRQQKNNSLLEEFFSNIL